MIKCPNCGSTAQVRLIAYDDLSNKDTADFNWIHQHYICGCGCSFTMTWIQEGIFKKKK